VRSAAAEGQGAVRITVDIDGSRGLRRYRATAAFGAADVERAVAATLEHPRFRPGYAALWDLRAAPGGFPPEDLARLLTLDRRYRERMAAPRTAIVVEGDLAFGLMRRFEMMGDLEEKGVAVFRDLEAALAWVEGD